jgi:DNA-directed RNA polymerase specialized sigma subunit
MRNQFRSEDVARAGKPRPCPECPKYRTCTELCERVERWVDQDRVGRSSREVLETKVPDMDVFSNEFLDYMNIHHRVEIEPDPEYSRRAWERLKSLNLSKLSMDFARLYYWEGKSLSRVAAILLISAQAADDRHNILKNEIRDKLERQEKWEEMKHLFQDSCKTYASMVICMYYKDLYNITDIAEMLETNYDHVYHIVKTAIQEYLDKLASI